MLHRHWRLWVHLRERNVVHAVLRLSLDGTTKLLDSLLLCADAILSWSLGWAQPLPLYGLHVNRMTLRAASEGEDVRLACHSAISQAARDAVRLAHDLARRAAHLNAVTHKLRSKGSNEAIALFLSEDAILPSAMLSPVIRGSSTSMTSRSARRFCERLIELGVVRELTGRSTFRLYGVT